MYSDFVTKKLSIKRMYPSISHVSLNVEDGNQSIASTLSLQRETYIRASRVFNLLCNFKNFKSSALGIDHTKVSITNVGGGTGESGGSTTCPRVHEEL